MYDALDEKTVVIESSEENLTPVSLNWEGIGLYSPRDQVYVSHSGGQTNTNIVCTIKDGDNCENVSRDLDLLCENLESVEMKEESDNTHSDRSGMSHCTKDIVIRTVFAQDTDGDTLLHSAIIMLQEQLAHEFINTAPSCRWLDITNGLKQTSLHLAVLTKQLSIVRRLVVGGADITARDRWGNTPLHIACREGHTAIARALMEPVRYLETKQNCYDIPYQRIPQNLQLVNYEGLPVLHLAASNGHIDIVKLLIDKQADIDSKDLKSGRTVLHMACEEGNLEMVRFLLKHKPCDINARTYNDLTPFDRARDRGHTRITFELAVAGANIVEGNNMDDY